MGTSTLLVVLNLFGMFPGYASFGWVADYLGRRRSFLLYAFAAAATVPLYAMARNAGTLLIVGTIVAFFGTGFFSGSGIVGSEIFPTRVRARALGFTYNGARYELHCPVCDRVCRAEARAELGLLLMRGLVLYGRPGVAPAAGDQRKAAGVA
jgi:hypothetical protein